MNTPISNSSYSATINRFSIHTSDAGRSSHGSNGRSAPWHSGETLELPVHEIHGRSPDDETLEFLLNERDEANWIFRRDPRIRRALEAAVVGTAYGVAALAPEIVLLFKANSPREKDEHDFNAAVDVLSKQQRRWLRSALQTSAPDHRWIEHLT